MRADYINLARNKIELDSFGVPLGGTLSPVLSNIYLHELDLFVNTINSDDSYNLRFVRYADVFVIGFRGFYSNVELVYNQVKFFLQNQLMLCDEKLLITNLKSDRAYFLGAEFRILTSRIDNYKGGSSGSSGKLVLLAPLEILAKKLEELGVCKISHFATRDFIPIRKTA